MEMNRPDAQKQEELRQGPIGPQTEQPPCVKFELDRAAESGVDLRPFAGFADGELRQMRLAYEHGVGEQLREIALKDDPGFNHVQLEILRVGLEQELPVEVYAHPDLDCNQMHQLRLALAAELPASRIVRPDPLRFPERRYSGDQMRELRLAMEEGLDISPLEDPDLPWQAMQEKRSLMRSRSFSKRFRSALRAFRSECRRR